MPKKPKLMADKFKGPLSEPIIADWPPPLSALSGTIDQQKIQTDLVRCFEERFKKLSLLVDHYGAKTDGKIDFVKLVWAMASDLVPGFQILYDDPISRSLGLPNAYYGKTKPKGASALPEFLSGKAFIALADLFLKDRPKASDREIAEFLVSCVRNDLKGPAKRIEREKKIKTLRNRLATARNSKTKVADANDG
jgi:hypothetical protein